MSSTRKPTATKSKRPGKSSGRAPLFAPDSPNARCRYDPSFVAMAERLCGLFGSTDDELGQFFGVPKQTIELWRKSHPEFAEACQRGKDMADDMVERRLFQRAMGWEHDAVKIMQFQGEPVIVPYREKFAPDVTAQIFWLKNRRRDRWRDRQEHEHTLNDGLAETLRKRRERAKHGRGTVSK